MNYWFKNKWCRNTRPSHPSQDRSHSQSTDAGHALNISSTIHLVLYSPLLYELLLQKQAMQEHRLLLSKPRVAFWKKQHPLHAGLTQPEPFLVKQFRHTSLWMNARKQKVMPCLGEVMVLFLCLLCFAYGIPQKYRILCALTFFWSVYRCWRAFLSSMHCCC